MHHALPVCVNFPALGCVRVGKESNNARQQIDRRSRSTQPSSAIFIKLRFESTFPDERLGKRSVHEFSFASKAAARRVT
jgi:hypothetical protein